MPSWRTPVPLANLGGDVQVVEVRAATRADIPLPQLENPNALRVSRLSPLARDVVERMAIVGGRVSGTLLDRIALRSEDELLDALDELIKRKFLVDDKGENTYRFLEEDDRKAIVDALPPERRRHLHLLVARALHEDARRHRRPPHPEEQARHYIAGGEPVLALAQLVAAARNALDAAATQTAAGHVREAQDLYAKASAHAGLDSDLMRHDVELVILRLDVLSAASEHSECVGLARRRVPKMRGVDSRLLGEVLLRLAAAERALGELDRALAHTGEVLAITERGGAHELRCRAKNLCGAIYEQRGQFDISARYYSASLELARTIGDDLEEERARAAIGFRRLLEGDLYAAGRDFDELLTQAQSRGEKLRISGYINALGIIAHEQGRYDEAEVAYRRMIELAKPAGDRRAYATGMGNIGVVRRDQGRYEDALNLFGKAGRMLVDTENVESLSYLRITEAQTLHDRNTGDDNENALEKAREARELGEKAGVALKVAEAELCQGLALCRLGRYGTDEVERGLEAARRVNANRILLFGLAVATEARAVTGDFGGASESLEEGRARAARTGFVRYVERFDALAQRLALS